jgi:flagellar biogenesis protein FliO
MPVRILFAVDTLNPPMGSWFDYAKTLLVLAAICLLALFAVKVGIPKLRRMAVPTSSYLQIVERYPLEPRKTLYVVKVSGKLLLLASSTEAVHFITTLDPNDNEHPVPPPQVDSGNTSIFARIAGDLKNRRVDRT